MAVPKSGFKCDVAFKSCAKSPARAQHCQPTGEEQSPKVGGIAVAQGDPALEGCRRSFGVLLTSASRLLSQVHRGRADVTYDRRVTGYLRPPPSRSDPTPPPANP